MILKFRVATEDDLPILRRFLAELGEPVQMSEAQMRQVFAQMSQVPHYHCYLAEVAGEAVGTFSLLILPTLMHDGAKTALLDAVVVSADFRGKGIGQAMMQEVMQICKAAGCYKITLSSNLKRDRAHRFYENLGFKQHGWSFSLDLA